MYLCRLAWPHGRHQSRSMRSPYLAKIKYTHTHRRRHMTVPACLGACCIYLASQNAIACHLTCRLTCIWLDVALGSSLRRCRRRRCRLCLFPPLLSLVCSFCCCCCSSKPLSEPVSLACSLINPQECSFSCVAVVFVCCCCCGCW